MIGSIMESIFVYTLAEILLSDYRIFTEKQKTLPEFETCSGRTSQGLHLNLFRLNGELLNVPEMTQLLKDIPKRSLGNDFPIITFGTTHAPDTDSIMLDYAASGKKLASHLYDNGCRTLLIISGGLLSKREEGILCAAAERGLPPPEIILDREMTLESEYRIIKEYLQMRIFSLPDNQKNAANRCHPA